MNMVIISFMPEMNGIFSLKKRLPEEERYDGYLQLENGVGMMRLLQNEFAEEYAGLEGDDTEREVSIATGVLAYPLICKMASSD